MENNPIIELSELVQKQFGQSIKTSVVSKTGPDHCPTVFAKIELPNSNTFTAAGSNKKVAKQIAAKKALKHLLENYYG